MDRSDLPALQAFVVIARQGSLRAAARVLGVNPPAISHQLKTFEERLGTALFLRSTRSVTLTDAGRALYESSSHLLAALDEALGSVRNAARARSGRLRITLPFRAWQVILAPRIAAFQQAYPEIVLDLTIDEALTDVVARGFHAGIRLGDYLQDEMIAVRLSPFEEAAYVAAPDYLKRYGVPSRPQDLLDHVCIRHRQVTSGRLSEWRFNGPEGDLSVEVDGPLIMDDMRAVVDAARLGLGIGWSLRRGVQQDLDNGALLQVLSRFTPSRPGFFVYFPKSLQHLGPLRAFIEHFRCA
ncbi:MULTISPECIES: LysR family transcriptional regulator [unclassified Mesorhizobium]|uniref:LysR family transcriptional regulator n=1 Tax=unclassified Mesorhizobium TaxID=325217 RepID=UPI000BAF8E9D|nr:MULTISPECIES: LysR family transcriptional regulator [unclassified Mesorhizobium]TGT60521.1 LysR family transcriptional regulator [Mesorhizobium sp. M00.F.Ca.ET.170.01.1.1]AZO10376.1 LysR family transcriptional regulator [Mesorhizobium sp. M3A.F.Ca.ET.080.04.2.1]PBB87900.1 LysR family transcriptional regulator [Mesorhizobium sp. WSM3876]RWB73629.1 MAG: LysR family transcriptional regulator [Mesorhizobium sp.]RWB91814.1 MAG: LysR family transcriptional regulator [Mesorhizobium sp.]